jgi:hypothetical protein
MFKTWKTKRIFFEWHSYLITGVVSLIEATPYFLIIFTLYLMLSYNTSNIAILISLWAITMTYHIATLIPIKSYLKSTSNITTFALYKSHLKDTYYIAMLVLLKRHSNAVQKWVCNNYKPTAYPTKWHCKKLQSRKCSAEMGSQKCEPIL